ncbi:branched-chain amino acid ABC transporter substrate-binding protein [Lactobacillus delbrueckii subsp. allosunkii]|jgi:branched-chain amino acid transport system substrate-binding protein|nr:branched-chain amino acid ABC transporter substrate-binding protein [Lactobacillus delbrueckii subsp. sunkii]GHN14531.1 branched-chain amino acid ABC transporter substrate-binding protein [Lactobacillus delbrueckii subsp. sunkii]GHN15698.1 branched-chain amino acid ABC transporter substrate-binding protein [Lactobacillus delbrueckii]
MYLIEMGKTIMNFKKAFGVAAATMMSAAALTGCATAKTSSTAGNKSSDNTIRIGVNLELSGSVASYGQQEKKGVVLAAQEINKKGVKIGGKTYKVKLYISDNKSSTSTAASVAAQMANSDKIVAQVGPAATAYATASIANLTKAGVPMVGPSATASEFTQTKSGQTQKYAFRACFIDPFQGKKAADFMYNTLKKKSVAILADNSTDYGTGLTKSFTKEFKKLGGKVVTTQYFQSGDKDFNSTLTTIKGKKPDALYLPGYYTEIGLILKQAREMGLNVPVVGSDGMGSPKLAQIAGKKNATNVYYTTHFSIKSKEPEVVKFLKTYKAKYGEEPATFSSLAYDSVYMIVDAAKKEGEVSSSAIQKGLASLKNFKGVTGKITMDSKHNPQKSVVVEQMTNGKINKAYTVK